MEYFIITFVAIANEPANHKTITVMKKTLLLCALTFSAMMLSAQKKPFEGTMVMKQSTYFHQGKIPQTSDVQMIQIKGNKSVWRNSAGEVVIMDYSTPGQVTTATTVKASSGAYIALQLSSPLDMGMAAPMKKLEESPALDTINKFDFDWESRKIKDPRIDIQGDFHKEYYQQMGNIENPIASKMSFTYYSSGQPVATTTTELLAFAPKTIDEAGFSLPEGTIVCNSVDEFTKCLQRESAKRILSIAGKSKVGSKKSDKTITAPAPQSAPTTGSALTGDKFIESITTNPVVPESLWDF